MMNVHPNTVFSSFLGFYNINTEIVRTSEVAIKTTLSLNHAGCDKVQLVPVADHGSVEPEAYKFLGPSF